MTDKKILDILLNQDLRQGISKALSRYGLTEDEVSVGYDKKNNLLKIEVYTKNKNYWLKDHIIKMFFDGIDKNSSDVVKDFYYFKQGFLRGVGEAQRRE